MWQGDTGHVRMGALEDVVSAMHAVRQAHTTCHAVLLAFSAAVQQDVHRLLTDSAHDSLAQADRTPPVKVIAMTHGGESHALETSELAQQIDKYCKKNQLNLRWGFAEKCKRQDEMAVWLGNLGRLWARRIWGQRWW